MILIKRSMEKYNEALCAHIFTSSHLHIFTSSHLHIFTPSHLHTFHTFTPSHLHTSPFNHIFQPQHHKRCGLTSILLIARNTLLVFLKLRLRPVRLSFFPRALYHSIYGRPHYPIVRRSGWNNGKYFMEPHRLRI
ncbi:hypothetical protein GQ43DRAFT_466310 [Delitschia confertaspora ATCC 74209]|uniref:Uncharacterized protein n=1 Tax=Delitschia confertaspora ATCC 74209 TaxID=1513339 RepID=A0A9P4JI03_9PLEO|nr:hypothetical protein GQ43DRAFT_466310 [Delitschia confertaspora ATCC 74209]